MVFSSISFLFYLLPGLLACYFALPSRFRQGRNLILLAFSLIFYAWGEGAFVFILLAMTLVNHSLGVRLSKAPGRLLLGAGIVLNLIPLISFKYSGFFASQIGFSDWQSMPLLLGISFFTFQSISFLVDVSRHNAVGPKSWTNTALYICAFPQLVAGPIVRYHTIADQLENRQETLDGFAKGIRYFVIGLGQKVIFANVLGQTADLVFGQPAGELGTAVAWLGLITFALQIYFDFAGYSNMALGLGHMFGFDYPQNFNFPYIARSFRDYWTRWHITLSTWFRDYLYFPLGGNRKGAFRTYLNLWIVFVLCGFWHGAAWTFVLWGAWQGAFLTMERMLPGRGVEALPRPLGHFYALSTIIISYVLFRSDDLGYAMGFYGAMFGQNTHASLTDISIFIGSGALGLMLLAMVFATPLPQLALGKLTKAFGSIAQWAGYLGLLLIFALCAVLIAGGAYNPFIYFRF